ncbi:hypothetical protein [Desulfuromonas thiophila]|uniref:hypothetical protein n=1 Tax=Desulfuromonas thiophila TaxID=57664 RepID=UPI0024A8FDF3|nr:hypothetical protein [Desulfuromonas thiophila]
MNPLVPSPDLLPVSRAMLEALLLLTFPLHLLFMNALLASVLLALWGHYRSAEPAAQRLSYRLAQLLPLLIAFTINFGIPPLLFIQVLYGNFVYASSIVMGVVWLSVIPLLLTLYYVAYVYDFNFWRLGRKAALLLAAVGLLVLAVAFVFSNNMTLMLKPEHWRAYFAADGGWFLNLAEPTLWPRYLHMLIGASGVGALLVALLVGLWRRQDPAVAELARRWALRLFLVILGLQIVVGSWFLLALPADVLLLFLGRNSLASLTFVLALVLVALLLYLSLRERFGLVAAGAVLLLYLMSFLRAFVREGYLAKTFVELVEQSPQDLTPLLLFVVTLVIGVALVAWMVRAALACRE